MSLPAASDAGAPGATAEPARVVGEESAPVPIASTDPSWGSRQALVTVVMFSDFQCPFCARVEVTLKQLKEKYGPEDLRIVWKNEPLPFHTNAKPAAEAAMAVLALGGNDAFWKFHDLAFKNQQTLSPAFYEAWAQEAGVTDLEKFRSLVASPAFQQKVARDHELAHTVGVNGTPAFFINGVSLSGAQPIDKFSAIIDDEMHKAKALLSAGLPKDNVYVALSTENWKNAPKGHDDEDEGDKPDTSVWKVPVGTAPVLGSKDALVTIVEYSDFQCPYCKRVEDSLKRVRATYGDKVRLVWKNEPLPFHPRAMPTAELALEARTQKGDKGFWDVHDRLFESQPKLEDADLDAVAKAAGLDLAKVHAALAMHKHKRAIELDADEADGLQASGTPHFFINGRRLVGAQPFEKFQALIDEELGKAKALVAKGTAPDAVYAAITKDGKTEQEPERRTVTPSAIAPVRGSAGAKVVIEEFSDFQCPFCARVEDTLKEVLKNYDGRVKLVWRNLPLPMHPDAPLAAEAGMEAYAQKGATGFWKMHDLLFAAQKTPDGLKRDALDGYAHQIGLDMDKWKKALDGNVHKPKVEADARAANEAGISGTPAFVVNGYYISGAQPYAKFRKTIERALADKAQPAKAAH